MGSWELELKAGTEGSWAAWDTTAQAVVTLSKSSGLTSGTTYYARARYVDDDFSTGDWSAEASFSFAILDLSAQGIALDGGPTISGAEVGQWHALLTQSIATGQITVTAASLTSASNIDALAAQNIAHSSAEISTPTISQLHVLSGDGVALGYSKIIESAISQTHALTGQDLSIGTAEISTASMSPTIALNGQSIALGSLTVSSSGIEQVHALAALNIVGGTCDIFQSSVGQEHTLLSQDVALGAAKVSISSADLFLPNPRITFESRVALRIIAGSAVSTGITAKPTVVKKITKPVSIGINIDVQQV